MTKRVLGVVRWCSLVCSFGLSGAVFAETATIAVASNFAVPARAIADAVEANSGHRFHIVVGSTGKLYAQIVNGARFDVFLAADVERPQALFDRGFSASGPPRIFARGRLAVWIPGAQHPDEETVTTFKPEHVAIANPALAPYGRAAMSALNALGLDQRWRERLVKAESVGGAFTLVASGSADLGFVALSSLLAYGADPAEFWRVPDHAYTAIEQAAIVLLPGAENPAVHAFMRAFEGDVYSQLMEQWGFAPVTP
ncbi:molybdate ABC transporter, periplasmic molybdate-binding protein [Luminiphilus syltensis NOR5-1B]|uniref:Molybdate ABC transporter, periplasmic molybdate-binding protein n=1 Tax=Luminiphilus syltensis NOR5-1B TaxID=565045 RepID=B8KWM4_9GAMM|nr:molybdate ABC transporter substrate-binding protein [Luminiphilus syltensis]EED36495.1 molybdate ABC transporter, periplasmic molybdate-binding protein [Luminiphilus syltensis NOR5-1B]